MSVAKKRLISGLRALGFVIVTLIAWWLFASLADTVVRCVPWGWGESCKSPFQAQLVDRPRLDTAISIAMLIVSLLAAIWVGNRLFYTADDFVPDKNAAQRAVNQ